jgi:hypothetical protein
MNKVLLLAAVSEAATGLALLLVPSLIGRLLLGVELTGVAVVIGRVTGIALVALGIACWPGRPALCGMLTYSALATLYLAFVGLGGELAGKLLWPAVVLHAILTALLARAWFQSHKTKLSNAQAKN